MELSKNKKALILLLIIISTVTLISNAIIYASNTYISDTKFITSVPNFTITACGTYNVNSCNVTMAADELHLTSKTFNAERSGNVSITGNLTISSLNEGSILFVGENGVLSERNDNLFYDDANGGSLAVGSNSKMKNIFQAVKEEGIRDIDKVKALITVVNTGTINGNWAGFAMETLDKEGNRHSATRIMSHILSHEENNVTADMMLETRFEGIREGKVWIKGNGTVGIGTDTPLEKLDVIGNIRADYYIEYSKEYVGDAIELLKLQTQIENNESNVWDYVDHTTGYPEGTIKEYTEEGYCKDLSASIGCKQLPKVLKNITYVIEINKENKTTYFEYTEEELLPQRKIYGRVLNDVVAINKKALLQLIERIEILEKKIID